MGHKKKKKKKIPQILLLWPFANRILKSFPTRHNPVFVGKELNCFSCPLTLEASEERCTLTTDAQETETPFAFVT